MICKPSVPVHCIQKKVAKDDVPYHFDITANVSWIVFKLSHAFQNSGVTHWRTCHVRRMFEDKNRWLRYFPKALCCFLKLQSFKNQQFHHQPCAHMMLLIFPWSSLNMLLHVVNSCLTPPLEHWYSEAVNHSATCSTTYLVWASWGVVMLVYVKWIIYFAFWGVNNHTERVHTVTVSKMYCKYIWIVSGLSNPLVFWFWDFAHMG